MEKLISEAVFADIVKEAYRSGEEGFLALNPEGEVEYLRVDELVQPACEFRPFFTIHKFRPILPKAYYETVSFLEEAVEDGQISEGSLEERIAELYEAERQKQLTSSLENFAKWCRIDELYDVYNTCVVALEA